MAKRSKEELQERRNFTEFYRATGVWITKDHTGKMRGIPSLSTSPFYNSRCVARHKNKATICSHCYSCAMHYQYEGLAGKTEHNSELLYHNLYPVYMWPDICYSKKFRLESFGDLATVIQGMNYCNFCLKNPTVHFAIYTKNPDILSDSFKMGIGKPGNMTVVYSSPYMNIENDPTYQRYRDIIDYVFTVYDEDGINNLGVNPHTYINCGARSCDRCEHCYIPGNELHVRELLKSQARRILGK